jgi:hypothetical protein
MRTYNYVNRCCLHIAGMQNEYQSLKNNEVHPCQRKLQVFHEK